MTYLRVGAVTLAAVIGTILLGWWFVGLLGLLAGLVSGPGRAPVLHSAAGAALGWGVILAGSAVSGPIWTLAQRVGPVFGVPGVGFLAIALLFPALLAGSAALVAGELRRFARPAKA